MCRGRLLEPRFLSTNWVSEWVSVPWLDPIRLMRLRAPSLASFARPSSSTGEMSVRKPLSWSQLRGARHTACTVYSTPLHWTSGLPCRGVQSELPFRFEMNRPGSLLLLPAMRRRRRMTHVSLSSQCTWCSSECCFALHMCVNLRVRACGWCEKERRNLAKTLLPRKMSPHAMNIHTSTVSWATDLQIRSVQIRFQFVHT